jgi:hypothetical protein
MLNSWSGQVYYWKDPFGIVHLFCAGPLIRTSSGTTVFTLPVGYRPAAFTRFIYHSADIGGTLIPGYGQIDNSNGNVTLDNLTGYQNYTDITGVNFAT